MTALLEESRREGWGPPQVQVDDDGLAKMMMMTHRDDPSSSVKVDDDGLTEDDWDVVCQFFWLPHSHGPMVERLLEDFRLCLVNMNSVMQLKWLIFTLTIPVHGTTIHLRQSSSSPPASPCPDPGI